MDVKTKYDSDTEDGSMPAKRATSADDLNEIDGLEEDFGKPAITDEDRAANQKNGGDKEEKDKLDLDNEGEEDENQVGSGYSEEKGGRFRGILKSRKAKAAGGAAAGILGGGMFGMMVFVPTMKLESMLSRLDNRAFAMAKGAVSNRVNRKLELYIVKRMLPAKKQCGTIVSKDCGVNHGKSNALFDAWTDSRFEARLQSKLGIDIELDTAGGDSHTITDRAGNRIKISDGNFLDNKGGNELGKSLRKTIKQETKWHQVMDRRSLRNGLKRKYNIDTWCHLACKSKDKLKSKNVAAKTRVQKAMIKRVIYPFSGKYGVYMECILGPAGKCTHDNISQRGKEKVTDAELEEIFKRFTTPDPPTPGTPDLPGGVPGEAPDSVPRLPDGVPDLPGNGIPDMPGTQGDLVGKKLTQIIMQKVIGKFLGEAAGKVAASSIPVAGQVYAGLTAFDMADQLWKKIDGNELSHFAADFNSSMYAEFYAMIRSSNDEIRAHSQNISEINAVNAQFDGSEESKIYQAHSQSNPEAATGSTGSTKEKDRCADDKPIKKGEFVCEEKKIARQFFFEEWADNPLVNGPMQATFTQYNLGCDAGNGVCIQKGVHGALDGINWVTGKITGAVMEQAMEIAKNIPVLNMVQEFAKTKMNEIFQMIFKRIFPSPLRLMAGLAKGSEAAKQIARENYDGLEGGAAATAESYTKGGVDKDGKAYGLGGKAVTGPEQNAILEDYYAQLDYEYETSSTFAKLTDLSRSDSLATHVIMGTPSNVGEVPTMVASAFSSIISGRFLSNIASTLFGGKSRVSAASSAAINPFGLTAYGIPADDIAITIDPDELTPEKCAEFAEARKQSKTFNDRTAFEEYSATDPCLLNGVSDEAAGSLFSKAWDEAGSSTPTTPTPGGETPIVTGDTTNIPCAAGTDKGAQDGYQGGNLVKIKTCDVQGIEVNSQVSGKIDQMVTAAKGAGVTLTGSGFRSMEAQKAFRIAHGCPDFTKPASTCSPPTAIPGTSNHQMGLAIDFKNCGNGSPSFNWLKANAATYGFKNLPSESWHWSVDGH